MSIKKIIKTKIVCLLFLVSVSAYSQTFGGGDGLTEATAFLISTRQHIEELAGIVNSGTVGTFPHNWTHGKYFKLTQDITDTVRVSIGKNFSSGHTSRMFEGHFCGGGNKITIGLVNTISNESFGLFSRVGSATIKNLTVDGFINQHGQAPCGGVIGNIAPTPSSFQVPTSTTYVMNVVSAVNITLIGDDSYGAGGVIGRANNAIIENCIFTGTIINTENYSYITGAIAGGIIAWAHNSSISGCISIGSLINTRNGNQQVVLGGIAAIAQNTTITNSINYGFLSCRDNNININAINGNGVGGIAGVALNCIISNNYNSGVIVGSENIGCIVGLNNGGTVINNHYDKQMCGEED